MSFAGDQRLLPLPAWLLLREERSALGRLRELLVMHATEEDLQVLRQAELDLDELFLLVVVGEFNAGKSPFINALIGEPIVAEGVTPTTATVTRLRYAPTHVERREGPILEIGYPLDLLRDLAIVDTPGTNAILREHEEITGHFVLRADLILFVTSADRPFTETERAFMERIRSWGKNVVMVLNKADLLRSEQELADQVMFVRQGVERLLGFTPQVFPVSARLALEARQMLTPAGAHRLDGGSGSETLEDRHGTSRSAPSDRPGGPIRAPARGHIRIRPAVAPGLARQYGARGAAPARPSARGGSAPSISSGCRHPGSFAGSGSGGPGGS